MAARRKTGGLTARQRLMINVLLSSKNIGEACKVCNITRPTLDRWLIIPEFNQALTRAENQLINGAARSLIAGQDLAIDTLRDMMTGPVPANVRRAAANDWLNHLFKVRELATLEERIRKLEERQ